MSHGTKHFRRGETIYAAFLKQFFILTSLPTKIHENVLKVTNVLRKAYTDDENTETENNEGILYSRHAQYTAHGPNVARESFQSGPQSPYLHTFGLIFDVNTM